VTANRQPYGRHAADHPIGQADLIQLIDDAPAPAEIRFPARVEIPKRQFFGHAATLCMKHADGTGFAVVQIGLVPISPKTTPSAPMTTARRNGVRPAG
jgi:hypothetical protein